MKKERYFSDSNLDKVINARVKEEIAGDKPTFSEKVTDKVAEFGGSWLFILLFTIYFFAWIYYNAFVNAFDPYPFILLTLILSCLAIYQAPFILMSQNRMADIDRKRELRAYKIAIKAEMEIKYLHEKCDMIIKLFEENKIDKS
jgi:uncharacterized membrane protein